MFKKIPHTFVIIFFIIIVAAIMTWFFPAGEFERTEKILPDGSSRSVIVEGSFQEVEAKPQNYFIKSKIKSAMSLATSVLDLTSYPVIPPERSRIVILLVSFANPACGSCNEFKTIISAFFSGGPAHFWNWPAPGPCPAPPPHTGA